MLGICETKFIEAITGKAPITTAMKTGTAAHEKLAEKMPKIEIKDVINNIKEGKAIEVRELTVYDNRFHISGRIDQLSIRGIIENGKNTGKIIDDKFPEDLTKIYGLTFYYKLQLTLYATIINNSDVYGGICKIIGAELNYRNKKNDDLIKHFDLERNRLETCISNVNIAIDDAWDIYNGKKTAEHRRLDIETGKWTNCYCKPKLEK
jgi:hypothetical protein